MRNAKRILSFLLSFLLAEAAFAAAPKDNCLPAVARPEIAASVSRAAQNPHPRLFATADEFAALKARAASDAYVRMGVESVLRRADRHLKTTPVTYDKTGKRLLSVCRTAVARISTLAMAYRLAGRDEHLVRARDELLAVCAFADWNPSHFLDVAEMSLAVATGYDWLYEFLDEDTRRIVAGALRRNGLEASRRPLWWIQARNNWGQVCHVGVLSAALALAEEDPAEAACFVQRAVDCLPLSMKALAPNGSYPEGPSYWYYGVEFNVLGLMLLEGTLGSDFGLLDQPGFKETAIYPDLVTGPSGEMFNYADGGSGRGSSMATWWFAKRLNRPDLLAFERGAFRQACAPKRARNRDGGRLFAYGLFSVHEPPADAVSRLPDVWSGEGPVPIAVQRSGADRKKMLFAGLKGGSPSFNHGHMDGGSFIFEAKGVRWAIDLGPEAYYRAESRGVSLWRMTQESGRWRVYRLSTEAHNVLMLDGCAQAVKGFGRIVKAESDGGSVVEMDLSSLYTNATRVVRRGVMAPDGAGYTLTDTIEGLRPGAPIRWAMTTRATVTEEGDSLVLTQNGRTLRLRQTGRQKAAWSRAPASGKQEWDSPNPNCTQITFTVPMPPEGPATLAVTFEP